MRLEVPANEKYPSEKVIDQLRLDFPTDSKVDVKREKTGCKPLFTKSLTCDRKTSLTCEQKKEMWKLLKNQSSKEILSAIMPGFRNMNQTIDKY
mmetsp:Transcript_3223/g.3990  ORF Transcript_3223/g.3990 Transcript_3223/m.3990 type:complete len:94 (+) Transcript_3223:251-532(+)